MFECSDGETKGLLYAYTRARPFQQMTASERCVGKLLSRKRMDGEKCKREILRIFWKTNGDFKYLQINIFNFDNLSEAFLLNLLIVQPFYPVRYVTNPAAWSAIPKG